MEQQPAQYLMSMKRKHIMTIQASVMRNMNPYDSWEEKAFAQDSAEVLGGSCIWPPRSYCCSFCRRDFRSAQALGGHMNIHRRDRARLKQSLSPENEITRDEDDPLHHDEILYFNNHYPDNSSPGLIASSTSENYWVPYVCSQFSSNLEKGAKKKENVQTGHEVYVDTDLSMGLNFVVRPNNRPIGSDKDYHELISCKRHKTCKVIPSSMEELDLELRLGDDPVPKAVKL